MAIFPIRDVAKYGIITDQDPYDIPTEAWSLGCNVRFQNRKVSRGPVWRAVQQPLSESNPRFVVGNTFNTGQDNLFIGYLSGDVTKFLNGTETNYNPAAYSASSSDTIWTTTTLAGVLWINRSDRAPWFLRSSDIAFQKFHRREHSVDHIGLRSTHVWGCAPRVAVGMSVVDLNSSSAINGGQTITAVPLGPVGVHRNPLVSPTKGAATPLAEPLQNRSVTLSESL